jgi:hypothetical protein
MGLFLFLFFEEEELRRMGSRTPGSTKMEKRPSAGLEKIPRDVEGWGSEGEDRQSLQGWGRLAVQPLWNSVGGMREL